MVRNENGNGSKGGTPGTQPTLMTSQTANQMTCPIRTGPLAAVAVIQSLNRSAGVRS